jgi:phosphoenolpyruvate-protein phosphotransferase
VETNKEMRELKGMPGAPGYASGAVYIWQELDLTLPEPYPCEKPDEAWGDIRQAIDGVKADLAEMRARVLEEVGKEEAAIFDAHTMMVEDVALLDMVRGSLNRGVNPEKAWYEATEQFAQMLEGIPDPTLSARAADVRDVGRQVLAKLLGYTGELNTITEPAVIVAKDLAPSQTAQMDRAQVLAFCTAEGGPTSHTAILAKALGIPAVVAIGPQVLSLEPEDFVLVDAFKGKVTANPSDERTAQFEKRRQTSESQFAEDVTAASAPAITLDGVHTEVFANIGGEQDVPPAIAYGAEGIGLFRTEFLYLDRKTLPSVDQQVSAYGKVIQALDGRALVVRTLDIGGDKSVDYLGITEEPNPFLGWRAIRMISEQPEVLSDQFYALLKAGQGTDMRIMVPMVARVSEVTAARKLFDEALRRVQEDLPGYQAEIQFGIMVEVPSAALMIEHMAPYVDFYSIGTNDLTQYTLAVDRMNARVAHIASPFSPAVLKLVERTIRVAHEHGKWVGMCGEFAGNPLAVQFLLGVGLDEFSMSGSAIPTVKRIIRECSIKECEEIAKQVLKLASPEEVEQYLRESAKGIL